MSLLSPSNEELKAEHDAKMRRWEKQKEINDKKREEREQAEKEYKREKEEKRKAREEQQRLKREREEAEQKAKENDEQALFDSLNFKSAKEFKKLCEANDQSIEANKKAIQDMKQRIEKAKQDRDKAEESYQDQIEKEDFKKATKLKADIMTYNDLIQSLEKKLDKLQSVSLEGVDRLQGMYDLESETMIEFVNQARPHIEALKEIFKQQEATEHVFMRETEKCIDELYRYRKEIDTSWFYNKVKIADIVPQFSYILKRSFKDLDSYLEYTGEPLDLSGLSNKFLIEE